MKKRSSVKSKVIKKRAQHPKTVKKDIHADDTVSEPTKPAPTKIPPTGDGQVKQTGETQMPPQPKDPHAYNPEQQMAGTDAARELGMEHEIVRS